MVAREIVARVSWFLYRLVQWILAYASFFIKDVSRLAIKSRKAKMAIQKPVKNIVFRVSVVYAVKTHIPIGTMEKSRFSPKNTNPYFPFTASVKVRKPKSKVKI